jgi:hypothetical protein
MVGKILEGIAEHECAYCTPIAPELVGRWRESA